MSTHQHVLPVTSLLPMTSLLQTAPARTCGIDALQRCSRPRLLALRFVQLRRQRQQGGATRGRGQSGSSSSMHAARNYGGSNSGDDGGSGGDGGPSDSSNGAEGAEQVEQPQRQQQASSSSGGSGSSGSSSNGGSSSSTSSTSADPPWSMTFIQRERTTLWTDENKARLVKLVAGGELGLDPVAVEYRVFELTTLLPDLTQRLSTISPRLLVTLLRDTAGVAERLIALRGLLPGADVGRLVAGAPHILLQDPTQLESEVQRLASLLCASPSALGHAVVQEPRLFDADAVEEVLEELRRLLPGSDAAKVLLGDPSWLLRVERGPKRLGQHPDT